MVRLRPVLLVTCACATLLCNPPFAERPTAQLGLSSRSIAQEASQLQSILGDIVASCPAQRQAIEGVMERLLKIGGDPSANEDLASVNAKLSAAKDEINRLESRRDALRQEVTAQQELANQLALKNVDAVLGALRSGDWLPIKDARTVLVDYVRDRANHIQVGGVTLVMTPFGYFEYTPVVEMNGRGSAFLKFHKLDFSDFGLVQAALQSRMTDGLRVKASYVEDTKSIQIEPELQSSELKDLSAAQTWRWTLTKSSRLFHHKSNGSFDLTTETGTSVANIPNRIEVRSWLGASWEVVKEIQIILSIGFALLAFSFGNKDWNRLIKNWTKQRWQRFRRASIVKS